VEYSSRLMELSIEDLEKEASSARKYISDINAEISRKKRIESSWTDLYLLNNCFNDKSSQHLGVKYNGRWYAITHNQQGGGILIPKSSLRMRNYSPKPEFLKRIHGSAPNIVKPAGCCINTLMLENFDKLNKF